MSDSRDLTKMMVELNDDAGLDLILEKVSQSSGPNQSTTWHLYHLDPRRGEVMLELTTRQLRLVLAGMSLVQYGKAMTAEWKKPAKS